MSEKMTLYSLSQDYLNLMDMIEDPDVDEECFRDTLEAIQGAIEVKADNLCKVLTKIDGTISLIDAEMERLKKVKDHMQTREKNMKDYLIYVMKQTGNTKIDTGLRKISVVKNGGLAPLIITGDVPDSFLKVVYEQDNTKIREALKNGKLDFAELGERGEHLRY